LREVSGSPNRVAAESRPVRIGTSRRKKDDLCARSKLRTEPPAVVTLGAQLGASGEGNALGGSVRCPVWAPSWQPEEESKWIGKVKNDLEKWW